MDDTSGHRPSPPKDFTTTFAYPVVVALGPTITGPGIAKGVLVGGEGTGD